jgi:deoxyadenosine/deoxycytidine kinase
MLNSDALTITLMGNIASGKTTALPIISKCLNGIPVAADEFFQTSDPFREDYLANHTRWSLANEFWLTLQRVNLINDMRQANTDRLLVIDNGLCMSWVYAYADYCASGLDSREWSLYQDYYSHLVDPLLQHSSIILLDCPIKELLIRVKKRGRAFELSNYTEEKYRLIEEGIKRFIHQRASLFSKIYTIDETTLGDFSSSKDAINALKTQVENKLEDREYQRK